MVQAEWLPPVALAGDIPAQLKLRTGMIDAAPMPPYPALLLQIFRDAKYMLDVHVAPLYGGVVMTNEAWNKIAADDSGRRERREGAREAPARRGRSWTRTRSRR